MKMTKMMEVMTLIYDASEFEANNSNQKPDNILTEEGEKSPKGQL